MCRVCLKVGFEKSKLGVQEGEFKMEQNIMDARLDVRKYTFITRGNARQVILFQVKN